MRSNRTIKTPGGDMLFDPALANQLARGDLIALRGTAAGIPWRIVRLRRMPTDPMRVELLWTAAPHDPKAGGRLELGVNDVVLRATGAGAGGPL